MVQSWQLPAGESHTHLIETGTGPELALWMKTNTQQQQQPAK